LDPLKDIQFAYDVNFSMFAASHLARMRETQDITLRLFLAGLYIGSFERLLAYFSDWRTAIQLLPRSCEIEKPLWIYWTEMYQELASDKGLGMAVFDSDVIELLKDAAEIAVSRGRNSELRLADILLAVASNQELDPCKAFIDAGLDISSVQTNSTQKDDTG
jgi:hypothetical protein